jgi:predicted DsbA family dithiol-disulfide isomerase
MVPGQPFAGPKRRGAALGMLAEEGLTFNVRFRPFQLNPEMPPEGVDRREYRSAKFGSWEKSQELDRRVADAGRIAGLEFRNDLMVRTPNTLEAHRLMRLAAFSAGDAGRHEVLAEDEGYRRAGISGVPSFVLDRHLLFSGAMPPENIADGLRRAVAILRERAKEAAQA